MNKNQKLVLDFLKTRYLRVPFLSIWYLCEDGDSVPRKVMKACLCLTEMEEFEVLAEFAEWGLKREN